MNKKDYINAMNEIKADDNLKKKTIEKLTIKKTKIYAIPKKILSAAAVFLLLFSFVYMNKELPKENIVENKKIAKLPTVGSYSNMKQMINNSQKYRSEVDYDMVNESSIMNSNLKTSEGNNDFSTTNVQVEGVDEADIVKTNGNYIFYYRDTKNAVSVIDVKDEKTIETIEYEDTQPIDMYLNNDKLIVIANYREKEKSKLRGNYNYKNKIQVIEYDISNINNIKVAREVEVEGNLITSRMINNYVYIISNKYIYNEMLEDEDLLKPSYKDTAIGKDVKCIEYKDIQYFPNTEANSYMMVSSFNINDDKPVNIQTYLGNGNKVYASLENLYVTCKAYTADNETNSIAIRYSSYKNSTKVYKFNLKKGEIDYVASATVPGSVNNQFSMDEYNGYFRIATTHSSKETEYKNVNNLYVLDENMNLVGQLEDLAPDEKIYSVRYMGNLAYVVTFKQVDPLFVIDLSNPKKPTVLGQLKIPGYSDYLHPYDETHIIGFGKDTEDNGNVVKEKGFKMALFDVSDVSNPKELYSVKIGDIGTHSELLYNHKALLFSKEKNIIAFPITVREKQNSSRYYGKTTFEGAIIYGLSLENGFEERARISRTEDFLIERIIYIDNNIYALAQDLVKIIDMNTMESIGEIKL